MSGDENIDAVDRLRDSGIEGLSAFLLQSILGSGNSERLEGEARRFLENDPEDLSAHFYLVVALVDQDRSREALPHVQFLLSEAPEDTDSHLAAATYHKAEGNWQEVRKHAEEGVRLDPELAVFHYFLAKCEADSLNLAPAIKHAARARELDPESAIYANLAIRLAGIAHHSTVDDWNRIEEYREALKRDPEDASLHNGIGDVYLEKLDYPREAEEHYRSALRSEPRNHEYQQNLFHAVARRSLIYQLVSLPSRCFAWIAALAFGIRKQPWWILSVVIAIGAICAFLAWLVLATLLFWLPGKIYEWLLVSEIKAGSRVSDTQLRWWFRFHRLPLIFRFGLFLGLVGIGWLILFGLMSIPIADGFLILALLVAIHFAFVLISFLGNRVRSIWAERLANNPIPGPTGL